MYNQKNSGIFTYNRIQKYVIFKTAYWWWRAISFFHQIDLCRKRYLWTREPHLSLKLFTLLSISKSN